jgi:hypothetical protein
MASQASERQRVKDITHVPKSLKRLHEIKPSDILGVIDDQKSDLQESLVLNVIRTYESLENQQGLTDAQKLHFLTPYIMTLCLNQTGSKFL